MQYIRTAYFGIKGYSQFTKEGFLSKKLDTKPLQVSLDDKVCIVTGASGTGLGFETALELAKRKGIVHILCRNPKTGEEARQKIIEISKNPNVHLHIVDLSLMEEVKRFTKTFLQSEKKLNVLVNNAGILPAKREVTKEGLESTFATNTMATFLLTKELMPLLLKSGTTEDPARVVIVSSGGMYTTALDTDDLNYEKKTFSGDGAYAQTKRQQVVLAKLFAERIEKEKGNVVVHSMHPGWVDTPGVEKSLPGFHKSLKNSLRTTQQGIDTILWLAASKEAIQHGNSGGGLFFFDREPVEEHLSYIPSMFSTEETKEKREDLWRALEKVEKAQKI